MEYENIFWKIYNAQNENELHKFVTTNELLTNQENWYPYGGKDKEDRSNFNIFTPWSLD